MYGVTWVDTASSPRQSEFSPLQADAWHFRNWENWIGRHLGPDFGSSRSVWFVVAAVLLSAVVFLVDLFAPPSASIPFAYAAAVAISLGSRRTRLILGLTTVCCALTWVDIFVLKSHTPFRNLVAERFLTVFVIITVSSLGLLRLRAEERLRRANAELARSNAELEQFASVIAHDLRSPLTSISGWLQVLCESLGNRPSPEAVEARGFVQASVDHMARLLQHLLEYARVGRGGLRTGQCNSLAVFTKVLTGLKARLEAEKAQITYDDLPEVVADETLLAQLLQNLIENALKYHGDEPPRVHVSVKDEKGLWVFSVADNGIGIDPRHFPRIFQLFHRVHEDESKYAGTGIGLATCKKIIEKHGGRIWVESEVGKGTVFSFSLPK